MKTSFVWLKRILSLVVLALLIFAFFGEDPKWLREIAFGSLVIQPAFSIGFLVMLALTPIWGRFFCECLCPLGIIQSIVARIVRPCSAVRRVCTRLPMSRAQIVVRSVVFIAFSIALAIGYGALAHLITPYSIVGKALVLFTPGLVIFGFVVLSAIFNKGRFWCNWVCPVIKLTHNRPIRGRPYPRSVIDMLNWYKISIASRITRWTEYSRYLSVFNTLKTNTLSRLRTRH